MNKLTAIEQQRLQQLETKIERGLSSFFETGRALAEIKDRRLYRSEFGTWEEYLRKRWGLRKSYAGYLISAQKITKELKSSTMVEVLPSSERQVRPLQKLRTSEARQKAWNMAVNAAESVSGKGSVPNGSIVEAAVKELQEPKSVGNGGPYDPTLEVAWILEYLKVWGSKFNEFDNAVKVGKFSPEALDFVIRRYGRLQSRIERSKDLCLRVKN